MKIPDGGQDRSEKHEQARGLTVVEINALGAPEAPGADHEEGAQKDVGHPDHGAPPGLHGIAQAQMHHRSQATGSAGDGHADKILAARAAGILGLRIELNVEARQAAGAGGEKRECDDRAELQPACRAGPRRACGAGQKKPHIQARIPGATPKVTTSASESSSLPKSLVVWVRRAMAPSMPSKKYGKADGDGRMIEINGGRAQGIGAGRANQSLGVGSAERRLR